MNYYNEHDEFAAKWLRNLIRDGVIAPGEVDERSIEDVRPSDLRGFFQCHFFAGIGVWSGALRRAGWADDRPIWSASCPCQPFSTAGKGDGFADERHLWPAFYHLAEQCRPPGIVGEQVASGDAQAWIDLVHTDMEALGYAFGAVPFPATSVGAPHIRDRLYWVADRTDRRSVLFGGFKGLSVPAAVEMGSEQQGVSLQEYSQRQGIDAPTSRGSGTRANCRPHQSGQVGQQTVQFENSHVFREQPQQKAELGRSVFAEGSNQMASVFVDRQEVSMAWIVCDEGGCDTGESECVDVYRVVDADHESSSTDCEPFGVGDTERYVSGRRPTEAFGPQSTSRGEQEPEDHRLEHAGSGADWLAHHHSGLEGRGQHRSGRADECAVGSHGVAYHGATLFDQTHGFWRHPDWIFCRDGKWRPVEPGTEPLAHGLARGMGTLDPRLAGLASVAGLDAASLKRAKAYRVGSLRGYGNAIVMPQAVEFIRAYMDACKD